LIAGFFIFRIGGWRGALIEMPAGGARICCFPGRRFMSCLSYPAAGAERNAADAGSIYGIL